MRLRFGGLAAALLLVAGPAATAERMDPFRTEAIAVTPPDGWVLSVWKGATIETAEFTPKGQTGGGYVDLLGYSALPLVPGVAPAGQADAAAFEHRIKPAGCRASAMREVQNRPGWYADQVICLGRAGAADPGVVELEFADTRVTGESAFRVWRTWRGGPAELSAMLKARTGRDLAPVTGSGAAQKVDPAAFDATVAALLPVFEKDLERSEVCDLKAPGGCRAFKDALPKEATERLRGTFIAGFYGKGLSLLSREEFRRRFNVRGPDDGTPNQAFIIIEPGDVDWNDPEALRRVALLVGAGQTADGGSLVVSDPKGALSPAERAQLRAHLLMVGRTLWREGYPPDIIAFRIPAAD